MANKMDVTLLKERTFLLGIRCIRLVESLPEGMTKQTVGRQLFRCATSVGANYRSASRARSRADFIAKMGIAEEECDETIYWIEVLIEIGKIPSSKTSELIVEANEILSILVSSIKTARKNAKS